MTHIDPVAGSAALQAHMAELHASAQVAKAAPKVSDPDHDGDTDGGGTDVKA